MNGLIETSAFFVKLIYVESRTWQAGFPDSMALAVGLTTRTGVHSARHNHQTNVTLQTSCYNGQDMALNRRLWASDKGRFPLEHVIIDSSRLGQRSCIVSRMRRRSTGTLCACDDLNKTEHHPDLMSTAVLQEGNATLRLARRDQTLLA